MLLVDPRPDSRARDSRVIASADYRLKAVPSALHALRFLETEKVAVVVAENLMPGQSGLDLLVLVRQRFPRTRGVLQAEHPRSQLVSRARVLADARTLVRPVPPDKLLNVIREEFDAYGR